SRDEDRLRALPVTSPRDVDLALQLGASRDLMLGLRTLVHHACESVGVEDALSDRDYADRQVGDLNFVPPSTRAKVQALFEAFRERTEAAMGVSLDRLAPQLDDAQAMADPFEVVMNLVDY